MGRSDKTGNLILNRFRIEAKLSPEDNTEIDMEKLAPVSICVLEGPKHIFTLANESYFSSIFNQNREILGKAVFDVFPELKGQECEHRLNEVCQTGNSYITTEMLLQITQKDLINKKYVDFISSPTHDVEAAQSHISSHYRCDG